MPDILTQRNPIDDLVALVMERRNALVRSDGEAMRRILASEYLYVNAGGAKMNREEYLEFYIDSGRMRWLTQDVDDLEINLYGDAAVVTCIVRDKATFDGAGFDARFRSMHMFIRRDDRWLLVASQSTHAPG